MTVKSVLFVYIREIRTLYASKNMQLKTIIFTKELNLGS